MLDFKELQTPPGHGDVLVMPAAAYLPELAESNRRHLRTNEFRVLDVSSRDCRCMARQRFYADLRGKIWIATGHQPEFIHPGVWAKHIVTQRLADRLGGVAANLIVDHDAVKEAALVVPSDQGGHLHRQRIGFAPYRPGIPWEALPALSPEELADFRRRVREAYGPRYDASLMDVYFEAAMGVQDPEDWVEQTAAGRRAIDALFGVKFLRSRAHGVWGGPLLAQMLIDADNFVDCYNAALGEYRRQLGIKGNLRPIPDMARRGDLLELPIWAVRPGLPRQRVFIRREGDRIDLFAEMDPIGSLSVAQLRRWESAERELGQVQAGLRPRALTLTIWARLFLADLFIHGIGGAKYDRITDILIRRYFGIEPPGICCVSATLRLELPMHPVGGHDLHEMRRRLREVRHKPQAYVSGDGRIEELAAEKARLVKRSEWLRENAPEDKFARRDVFQRIHEVNERMLHLAPGVVERLAAEHERVGRQLAENGVARSREYFIGLYRREDLQYLADNLPQF